MSGFGGFGGFGQNNNQQQSNGFGGFGANTNTNTGFGSTGNTGFGSTNPTGGGLFGGGAGASTGFGNSGGGFGSTTNNAFGAKPSGFGTATTSSGGLFGSGTATAGSTGFGGFGSTSNAATSSPFGAANTGGGLFGASKPAFGNSTTTSNPFGGGATTTPFGSTTTSAFGAPASTALGGGAGESPGTGSVPFQAFVEKEPNNSTNQQNSFQNICFQQPYQKFSPEELRLADYNQGRRYGNGSNQAGAFGQTNFGGFGSTTTNTGFGATNNTTTGTGLFGSTATSSPFGTSQPASTGFGTNTATAGGGLFGSKPATGGLFGSQPAAQTSGGLFGNTSGTGFGSTTTGAFGSNNNTSTGGSLFGNNSTTANKPFAFGNSQPAASTATGFGATTTTTSGFGGGLFGNNNQQQNTTTGFGAQPAASNLFGGFGGNSQQQTGTTSLFGNTANKPAGGLFGAPAASTGTSLFGNNQPAANTTPFGASTTTQTTGGLFGQKPATTTTGLFGNTGNTQNNTSTGLFGGFGNTQTQPQQQQQSSLFGNLNNNSNQQQKPSLFGNTGTQQQTSTSLFGNSGSQQQQGGLFGSLNNSQQGQQQQPQNSLFGGSNSMFGSSQQGQQIQSLTASINDATALGGSFFAGLGATQVPNPGPLATPLSSGVKAKKSAALPMYKLNSASASRFSTPQKPRGFGFSYSNYNSPSSASSAASTPGTFAGSLLSVGSGNTFGRTLSKSMSTSSLRRSFSAEDSILAPGAFSASPSSRQFGSTGSVKKLTISRNLRQDLFSPPNPQSQPTASTPLGGILKKRVSFDSNVNGNTNGASSPLKPADNATPSAEESGYMRPRTSNGTKMNGSSSAPEMEQVSHANNQLAIVAEEESVTPVQPVQKKQSVSQDDKEPGEYWMSPSKEEIEKMSRTQRQQVHLTVGRRNIGKVEFLVPVNLTDINLDDIMNGIVTFIHRSCTVYSNAAKKPPMGKGLNVPSRIWLENSWPRKKGSANQMHRHIERLRKVENTKFVNYNESNGTWCFEVEHFTTYGCPEDDDEDEFGQSTLSAPPDTPTPKMRGTPRSVDRSFASTSQVTDSDAEDTFEFRKKKVLPGAFDEQEAFVEEEPEQEYSDDQNSFLDERSVGSESEEGVHEPTDQDDAFRDDESVSIRDQEMAGSYPDAVNTTELMEEDSQDEDVGMEVMAETPGAIMRARMRAIKSGTPMKQRFSAGDDWANTLTATVSPKKQDRALLKSLVDLHGNDSRPHDRSTPVQRRVVSNGQGFATSIDLMNSLFGQARSPVKPAKVPATAKGFEWPYTKRPKTADHDTSNMSPQERAFRDSMKPSWGPDGTLVYAAASNIKPFGRSSRRARARDGLLNIQKGVIVSENRDVRFAKFSNEAAADLLKKHKELTSINDAGDVPFAYLERGSFSFLDFTTDINGCDPATTHEKLVWRLASVLFDPIVVPNELKNVPNVMDRLRKDKLSSFWQQLVDAASNTQATLARSNEEKAIACLSGHKVADACAYLVQSKDFHLATLVALIGNKDSMRKDMREQLNEWQKSRMLSEFSEPIRAIYELLAGNVCICDGFKGPEDRMESFVISKRFGLDWRRAFGLRLWYGILSSDPIESAIEGFADDLSQEKETSQPEPWYVESKVPTLWDDQDIADREDMLWGLLKLYTFHHVDIEEVLRPENSQLSPLDTRLSWQLSQALCNTDAVQYANDDEDRPDRLTLSFASQLTNEGSWLDATFVLLHLTRGVARAKSIQDHLAHHAGRIGAENSPAFTTLTQTLKIPAAWVWEAKALYMRSVEKNPRGEVECLIKAGSFNEAHRTFAKEVAPRAIVELDYDTLRTLLHGFDGKEDSILDWHVGGEIYQDYLYLLDCDKKGGAVDHDVLQRLLAGLPAVVEEACHPAFMETVAVETMSGVVAKTVIALGKKGEKDNLHKVLRLPLTEDKYLKHTVELSLEYYRAVMVSAK